MGEMAYPLPLAAGTRPWGVGIMSLIPDTGREVEWGRLR